jgi:sugar lactone lactonase YvrE
VTAGGTPSPWYQWNLNGTNISGATNTTLVLTNVQFSQAGTYTVLVTNAYGSVLSSNAVLTVNGIPPFITTQPTNQPVVVGGTATFSVTAGGTPSLSYRWYFNGTNLLAGATNTLLTLTNVQTTNTGNYSVVVTNVAGSVTSSNATLTVVPLLITTQPTNQAVAPGGTATFTVAVSGTGPFTYQWQLNGTNLPNNIITTVAGNGTGGYSGDNNAATTASLYYPTAVAVDSSGNLFIADDSNTLIRKVGTNGIITTVAGGGTNYPGNGGQATDAQLNDPVGVAVDASGNLFISDRLNYQRVYKVDTKGIMTTVAGSGTNYPGDGGQATNASLSQIEGVAVDASGNLYIADFNNNRIRKVDTTGIITTVAGNGIDGYSGDNGPATHAEMRSPIGVAVDASGNLFIADWENYCIRKVNTNGIITTVAGGGNAGYSGDNGPATHAQLDMASGVAVDAYGNLFIADLYNSRIREVTPNGIITTVAGNGNFGYSGDNGAATNATLNAPYGVAVDASGNLLIADFLNSRIRKVGLAGYPTLTLNNVTAANAGNYTVVITSPYGSVTSAPPARLTVTMQSGSAGQTANISVSSLGSSSSISGGKNVSFNITGSPGTSCDVYSSSDLKHWTFVGEVTMNASGIASFTVSVTSGMPQQFYRLVSAGQ